MLVSGSSGWNRSSSTRHALLSALLRGDASGYDLVKRFQPSAAHWWHPKPAQMYAELSRMEADGLVTAETVIQTKYPNKRVFSLASTCGDFAPSGSSKSRWIGSRTFGYSTATNSHQGCFMSTDESVTEDLIQTLEDGKDGYSKGADKLDELDETSLAAAFREFAEQRTRFADELQSMPPRTATTSIVRGRLPRPCIAAG